MPRYDSLEVKLTKIIGGEIALPIDKQMTYRVQNFTTSTPLGSSASYTGATIDGLNFKRLSGKVFANVAGNLYVEFSDDGINWDRISSYAVSAGTPIKYDEVIVTQCIRVVYVNGASAQGTFRLSGYLNVD
jgi:hypothetical protein